ncbi:sugar porter family MFS transporter [Belliella sp. R4-6]|uniref:Sugar porter family MFS transporter n=1 Tax=Belliella alkalica TaxID=1730871 RepID=A0ABS9VE71_9BACT|nr:sugar porter family MFS transporter [Belliella alkalica]MCH7414250.1 sugar porter family MFS transporter [Belliella alkalica]
MTKTQFYTVRIALIVALGGFLMGFDASVISGVVKFIEPEFNLTKLQLGWSVASLTLTATLAMMISGPLSDRFGRRKVLQWAAILFAVSALGSAVAPNFLLLVIARMLGGFGVGASLILAPMYIAEIASPSMRGRLVSFNQLNIVIGISVAFFTNFLILKLADSDASWAISLGFEKWNWRWMLGLEFFPAVLYYIGLFFVPKSPRWLVMKGQTDQALYIMRQFTDIQDAQKQIKDAIHKIDNEKEKEKIKITEFFKPAYRLVLVIGVVIAILQQITGINSVFFYAPMIFEQSGIGTDASFIQAILVGLTNLVFTVFAILFIDKLGRKPLLVGGLVGITLCMSLLAYGFGQATYELKETSISSLNENLDKSKLSELIGVVFDDDVSFKNALRLSLGESDALKFESEAITAAINMNPTLILIGILGFVASFAISIGPVMWVLFSELFPIHIKGVAISFVGFINSLISYLVQQFFPWQLDTMGSSTTFLIYGVFAAIGVVFVWFVVPETKNKSLEELETILIKK